ncbi:MAG TPA: hypothetical protein ENG98_02430 [Actinobacteria bacterium]|nr:hypothetical protein BMS3Bbin02_01499 [bacterium BMS3Bbin02]HDL41855.1 hypothetical protein [Actinomycetota bacterium]
MHRFDELLKQLVEIESEDAELHHRESTLDDRTRIHDKLVAMRAQMADLRSELGLDTVPVTENDAATRHFQAHG